ncbi:MAG: hypothetical protein JXA37_13050 [Chloroflexia bacterium]|nr:hypothetical protein [Chloroflexia bacterium]
MSWHGYRLEYRLLSPLHIGYRRLGNIQRTRYYLPGRNLWGAITARLTRALYPGPLPADYIAVGDYVREHLIAGYFFLRPDGGEPLYPRLEGRDCAYGALSEAEFEARHVHSISSTALSAPTITAEEASLHEIEYLAPRVQAGPAAGRPVYLTGALYLDQDRSTAPLPLQATADAALLTLLDELFVGGEQGYGFGRLVQEGKPIGPTVTGDSRPRPGELGGLLLRAHLALSPHEPSLALGPLEPLVGREWSNGQPGGGRAGAGQDLTRALLAWAPGGLYQSDPGRLRIGRYGIWEVDP